ncbi:MAG TPA: hypothetical protein H9880_10845 [Candidatus Anaerobutyricum avicola]|nr:hypothetical protein [Candidatus Anaerobutyricum avicola]
MEIFGWYSVTIYGKMVHKDELMQNWEIAKEKKPLKRMNPLNEYWSDTLPYYRNIKKEGVCCG